jgi:DNA repair protein RecO
MKKVVGEGIVLRRVNYGERDRVVTFLTKDSGKISLFAKGVRSQKSKLSAGIELLNVVEIGFIEGKSNLKTLTSTRILEVNNNIVKDISKTNLCFEALKLLNMIIEDNEGREYYQVLKTYLASLNDPGLDLRLVEVWFCLRILTLSGVMPDIIVEPGFGENYFFDYDRQVFVAKESGDFTKNDIKLLRLLRQNPKPIKLTKESGSEDQLLDFAKTLLQNNLQT